MEALNIEPSTATADGRETMEKHAIQTTIHELLSINPMLRKFVLRPLKSACRLNHNQFGILAFLDDVAKPMTMTQIAEAMCVSNQQLTALVDTLVKEGYVERSIDQSNRRQTYAAITDEGKEFIKDTRLQMVKEFMPYFENFSEDELEKLSVSAKTINEILSRK